MNVKDLQKLGLSESESTLYLALLKYGASDVRALIQETGYYKANVYQALERLIEKAIISKVVENNRRVYQIQNPHSLIEYVEKKKFELEDQEKIARELTKQVVLSKKHVNTPETAIVMRGYSAIKGVYKEIIEKKINYYVFGAPSVSLEIGEHYWKNLHIKQHENNVRCKMIFHKSLREWSSNILFSELEVRFFDEEFEPATETTIFGSKIMIVVWSKKPIVTIIDNQHVADSYMQVFEILWKMAKE